MKEDEEVNISDYNKRFKESWRLNLNRIRKEKREENPRKSVHGTV